MLNENCTIYGNKGKVLASSFSNEERIMFGCKAFAGMPVKKLAEEAGINREFIYTQKTKLKEILKNGFRAQQQNEQVLILDDKTINKTIIVCMLICKASCSDTQEFIEIIYGIHISIGKISQVINEAALKAKEWNSSIKLSNISTGANDEIFQANKPVLVGVEPISTFVYLMEEAENRDSTTWGYMLLEKEKQQGLHLETSVNDGGKGLNKGIKEAYPDCEIQADVFHAELDISSGLAGLEKDAYKAIKAEESATRKYINSKGKSDEKWENYKNAVNKSEKAIQLYDTMRILYIWLLEVLNIGGYFYEEKKELLNFIIAEMEHLSVTNAYLKKGIGFIKEHIAGLLQFANKAEVMINRLASEEGIDVDVVRKMWLQKGYQTSSPEYNFYEAEIGIALGERYTEIREKWNKMLKQIVRASSIVECINSLIRPYLSLKKTVLGNFLNLMQFYFNTRKYKRSRCEERIGKSPIELLTGEKYDDPLTILGY
jgi:hypothetical protein